MRDRMRRRRTALGMRAYATVVESCGVVFGSERCLWYSCRSLHWFVRMLQLLLPLTNGEARAGSLRHVIAIFPSSSALPLFPHTV